MTLYLNIKNRLLNSRVDLEKKKLFLTKGQSVIGVLNPLLFRTVSCVHSLSHLFVSQ
jgi:hypothetical protein